MLFLHQARKVRDLDPTQIDRIARRLPRPCARTGRTVRWPALAVIGVILGAGATVSLAMGGLRALPIVRSLLGAHSRAGGETGSGSSHKASKRSATERKPHAPLMVPTSLPDAVMPAASTFPVAPSEAPSERTPSHESARSPGRGAIAKPAGASLADRRESVRALAWSAPKPSVPQSSLPTPPGEEPLVTESRSFASVIMLWHRQRDPASALALLDGHDQRYPSGPMRAEAQILRAELYLAQGRRADALSILDGMSLLALPRARELRTVRGELRVQAGRCAEARADLGLVLEKDPTDSLAKRASQALSHCP